MVVHLSGSQDRKKFRATAQAALCLEVDPGWLPERPRT
jgi:hypothetical protein